MRRFCNNPWLPCGLCPASLIIGDVDAVDTASESTDEPIGKARVFNGHPTGSELRLNPVLDSFDAFGATDQERYQLSAGINCFEGVDTFVRVHHHKEGKSDTDAMLVLGNSCLATVFCYLRFLKMHNKNIEYRRKHTRHQTPPNGFTLIELLVVIAVISILMAILLPAFGKVRTLANQFKCAGQIRQITQFYGMYLNDNDDNFYSAQQSNNCEWDYGGWPGVDNRSPRRPINPYTGLPLEFASESDAVLFKCTGSGGDAKYTDRGNSYRANLFLLDRVPEGMNGPTGQIITKILQYNERLKSSNVFQPSRHLWIGDFNWYTHWDPTVDWVCAGSWHGRNHHFNLSFIDGHVDFVHVLKGIFATNEFDDYRIQPFKEVDEIAQQLQTEVACVCGKR